MDVLTTAIEVSQNKGFVNIYSLKTTPVERLPPTPYVDPLYNPYGVASPMGMAKDPLFTSPLAELLAAQSTPVPNMVPAITFTAAPVIFQPPIVPSAIAPIYIPTVNSGIDSGRPLTPITLNVEGERTVITTASPQHIATISAYIEAPSVATLLSQVSEADIRRLLKVKHTKTDGERYSGSLSDDNITLGKIAAGLGLPPGTTDTFIQCYLLTLVTNNAPK